LKEGGDGGDEDGRMIPIWILRASEGKIRVIINPEVRELRDFSGIPPAV
jgi:hypothetical protein